MNENIKMRNNNSSNDLTVINTSLINKTFKKSKRQIKKVRTAYKKDQAIGDFTKFVKNIYNNKINLYCCSSIYSAPSVKQSRIKIKKLIKENKNKTLNYLNNIHNSIMIRESKLYR